MADGIRWTAVDRSGNSIYLTEERWDHIIDPLNHPEMLAYERELQETIRMGNRKQDTRNPRKYRYTMAFDNLTEYNTHIVAIVLFKFRDNQINGPEPNNYIVTAYQKELG